MTGVSEREGQDSRQQRYRDWSGNRIEVSGITAGTSIWNGRIDSIAVNPNNPEA